MLIALLLRAYARVNSIDSPGSQTVVCVVLVTLLSGFAHS
nr:MAG TPA: hypothetical protein [Caudoviricetes sp.]